MTVQLISRYRRPYVIIPVSLLLCMAMAAGFTMMYTENDSTAMWMADGSEYKANNEWVNDNYPRADR